MRQLLSVLLRDTARYTDRDFLATLFRQIRTFGQVLFGPYSIRDKGFSIERSPDSGSPVEAMSQGEEDNGNLMFAAVPWYDFGVEKLKWAGTKKI